MTDFDLIVLGLGPGGEDLAEAMAKAGRSVLGIDERLVGGECPYYGCIPSKMMLRAGETLAEARRVEGLAGFAEVNPDFAPVHARIRDEATTDWDDATAVQRLEDSGATFVRGHGRLAGRDADGRLAVEVDGQTHRATDVVVATGTRPALPPIDGLAELYEAGGSVWTNREAMHAEAAPRSLVVLGGGAIGCELAQAFSRFGTEVFLVEPSERLAHPEEPDASEVLRNAFENAGISVHCHAKPTRVAAGGDGVEVTLDDGTTLTGEKLLVAAGRRPNLDDVGLDTVDLDPGAKALTTDDDMKVADHLYAIGDIAGHGQFTHVAVWQSRVLTAHLLDQPSKFGGYHGLAWVTFTDPEIGRVGLTEQQARDAGLNVRVGVQQIASNSRGWIYGPGNDGFVKLVEDADRGVLVGATAMGPHGGELLGLLTLAVHAEVPTRTMATMHYAFPTLHRAVLEALQALA